MKHGKNKLASVFRNFALAVIASCALASCGGGGGASDSGSQATATPALQLGVSLVEVSSSEKGVITASWLPASDDAAIASKLNYELHMNAAEGEFTPSSSTLKLRGQGVLSAKLTGLAAGRYSVKLLAQGANGEVGSSTAHNINVSDITSTVIQGSQVVVVNALHVTAVDTTPDTLNLSAHTSSGRCFS
jgi:hypothetical protein